MQWNSRLKTVSLQRRQRKSRVKGCLGGYPFWREWGGSPICKAALNHPVSTSSYINASISSVKLSPLKVKRKSYVLKPVRRGAEKENRPDNRRCNNRFKAVEFQNPSKGIMNGKSPCWANDWHCRSEVTIKKASLRSTDEVVPKPAVWASGWSLLVETLGSISWRAKRLD